MMAIVLLIYFAPAVTAYQRKTENKIQVLVINTFLGWTFIGWVVALSMAYSKKIEKKGNVSS